MPGDYRFEVTAANHHGVWNPEAGELRLLARAALLADVDLLRAVRLRSLVGLAAVIQAYRLRWQHRLLKVEEQRTLANERARIARDLHDDLGTALTGLALELDVVGPQGQAAGHRP